MVEMVAKISPTNIYREELHNTVKSMGLLRCIKILMCVNVWGTGVYNGSKIITLLQKQND